MSQYSKLDLFRREVDTQVTTLKQILPVLKTQPSAATELDQAAQAAHSLWGTASLVELDAAANLAQAMEQCFTTAVSQAAHLDDEHIDVLLHAGDLLLGISRAADDALEQWMVDHSWDLATTQKTISVIASQKGESKAQAGQARSQPSAVSHQEIESAPTPHLPLPTPHPPLPTPHPPSEPMSANLAAVLSNDDGSMMDLFRLEMEAQVAVLNDGLLALESNAHSGQALETLMRAAHSIKGSARIVALDAVVNLAHVMEDCFVAAQGKTIALNSDQVDVLLQGVDLLQGISQVSNADLPTWLTQKRSEFAQTQSQVAAILDPNAMPAPPGVASTSVSLPAPTLSVAVEIAAPSPAEALVNQTESTIAVATLPAVEKSGSPATAPPTNQDRVVRVSAENLNRIMGLAGESLIEANWLQPHADSMTSLKWRLVDLSRKLEELQDALDRGAYQNEARGFLDQARQKEQECLGFLSDRLNELELYAQRTANLSDRLYREVISSHMRPFADGVQGFPRMIRDLARKLNKQVKLEVLGKATSVDRDILKKLEAPLTHILRNAVDHGIELPAERVADGKPAEGTIRLEAFHRGGMLAITISDDGRGINPDWLRQKVINKKLATPEMVAQMKDAELMEFIFLPGFSTAKQVTEISGRGVGLDIAKSMAQEVGGTVRAISQVGKGTSFHFQLPLTLSVVRTLLVEISGSPYAIPLARIDQVLTVERSQIFDIENRQYFTMNQQNIGVIPAYQVLNLPPTPTPAQELSIVVISEQTNAYGLVVDQFLGERDLVVRPLDPRLGKVPDISATSLLGDGTPVLIVDVSDMVRSIDAILNNERVARVGIKTIVETQEKRKKILVVDDSITVREMERKLLENRGYTVDIAVNGAEGWNAVRANSYDLVISDIDMPKMNGIELVRQIKSHSRLQDLPVIIVSYRDREEDRIQGLDAGADYYLTKSSFHDDTFVGAVIDLIGK
ncbi:MAG: response regulator [Leptolyngbyaceae cyanobacterium bins.349]|nr:response regulator [Leptolyngbyaceae cyanobacterium bins.349]